MQPRNWKAFSFNSKNFLLHIPSSTLVTTTCDIEPLLQNPFAQISDLPDTLKTEIKNLESVIPKSLPPSQPVIDIKSLALNVMQTCNLRCTYCYAGDGDYGKSSKMSFETAKNALEKYSRCQPYFYVVFFGGEPLMNFPLIKKIVEWCEEQTQTKFSFGMTTNATLFNEEILSFFKRYEFKITISYDGDQNQSSKRLLTDKKSDSRPEVLAKLKKYNEALTSLRICDLRATLCKDDIDTLREKILSTLHSQTIRWAFVRHATNSKLDRLTLEDAHKIGGILNSVVDLYLKKQDYQSLLKLGNIKVHLSDIHHGKTKQKFCGAGISYLSVSTSGGLYLCHRFTEDEKGKVGDIEKGIQHEKLQSVQNLRSQKAPSCSVCWMREWCGGGCMHEHYTSKSEGKFDTVDPVFCTIQEYETTNAIRVYTEIQQHKPELLDKI